MKKYTLTLVFLSSALMFNLAYAQQCLNSDYLSTGSLTTGQFWQTYGRDAGVYLGYHNNKIWGCESLEQFSSSLNSCEILGERVNIGNIRVTWDPNLQVAYFAYRSISNVLNSGWIDSGMDYRFASPVLAAKTDETPVISYNPIRNSLLVAYEGNRSDDLYFAITGTPNRLIWSGNMRAGSGKTRFGPDRLCANSSEFILQYRGRTNTSRCYQTTYNTFTGRWGSEQSCSAL